MREEYEVLVILKAYATPDPEWLGTIRQKVGRAVVVTDPPPGLLTDRRIVCISRGSIPRRTIGELDSETAEFCRNWNRRLSNEAVQTQQGGRLLKEWLK